MRASAVRDYVKKKRVPNAYAGGEVDDKDPETPDEEPSEDDEPAEPAEPADDKPAPKDDAPAPVADEPSAPKVDAPTMSDADAKQQEIKNYLMKQYGQASDDSGIKAAVGDQKHKDLVANLGQAFSQMATSRAAANGYQQDNSTFQHIRDQGKAGVEQAQAARQQAVQGFLQKNELTRQVVQDQMAKGDFQSRQNAAKIEADRNDANSPTSAAMRPEYEKLWGESGEGLSAVQMHEMGLQHEQRAKIDEMADASKTRAKSLSDSAAERARLREELEQRKHEYADSKAAEGRKAKAGTSYTEMTKLQNGGRGDPKDVQQARSDVYSATKADELLKGDLNAKDPNQAALVVAEMEKIATGGQGTEGGRHALQDKTFQSDWAAFKNKFVGPNGEINGAELGPFLQRNKNYIDGIGKLASDKVRNYRRGVFDDYVGGERITEQHQATYKAKHPDEFPEEQEEALKPADKPVAQKGGSGEALAAPGGKSPPDGLVKMQSPDGEFSMVSPDAVEKYKKKGAKVIP